MALILSLVLGCGGKGKGQGTGDTAASTEGGDPTVARKELLGIEARPVEDRDGVTEVFLTMTDETGSSRRTKVDIYEGQCQRVALDASQGSGVAGEFLAVSCRQPDGGGRELRFVLRHGVLVLLEARFAAGESERSFEQRGSFALPSGAKIEAEPLDGEQPAGGE